MAKELMEIGGFITEGAGIVNHDASLSGNGTVDSPLGVSVVIYSGVGTTGNTVITSKVHSSIGVNYCYAIKQNDIITLNLAIDPMAVISIAAYTWVKLGTINPDLVPNTTIWFPFTMNNGSENIVGGFKITSEGSLEIRQNTTTNMFLRGASVTYSKSA